MFFHLSDVVVGGLWTFFMNHHHTSHILMNSNLFIITKILIRRRDQIVFTILNLILAPVFSHIHLQCPKDSCFPLKKEWWTLHLLHCLMVYSFAMAVLRACNSPNILSELAFWHKLLEVFQGCVEGNGIFCDIRTRKTWNRVWSVCLVGARCPHNQRLGSQWVVGFLCLLHRQLNLPHCHLQQCRLIPSQSHSLHSGWHQSHPAHFIEDPSLLVAFWNGKKYYVVSCLTKFNAKWILLLFTHSTKVTQYCLVSLLQSSRKVCTPLSPSPH